MANPLKKPPVVVVMGHIDHGKSTLLDFIRRTNVTEKEAGGITQHISAYEAVVHADADGKKQDRSITFIDTPGHEAFRAERDRGSRAADIAILVVSAEDGVKPQTKEAIEWITEHKLPFIVAFTKVDRPNANVDVAKQSLAEAGIFVEGYGGNTSWVAVSGKTGEGMDDLLSTILLLWDLSEEKEEEGAAPSGIIIESHRDPKRGITATAIMRSGSLAKGGFAATKRSVAPLRILENTFGRPIDEAHAGSPVMIIGWNAVPEVGQQFFVFKDKDSAAEYAASVKEERRSADRASDSGKKPIPVIAKADTEGGLQALIYEIRKFNHERAEIKIVVSGIGSISESDVKTAQTDKDSIIAAFHTGADASARSLAERSGIPIISNDIIYKLTEDLFEEVKKRAPKVTVEKIIGTAKIVRTFSKTRDKQIIGGKVSEGTIKVGAQVNIMRREAQLGTGRVKEMQYLKDRVTEASEGREFGAMVESKVELAVGDEIRAFELEETQ